MKKCLRVILFYIFLGYCCSAFSTTTSKGETLEPLTVVLDWFPNPDHAPLIIAKQKGFFAAQGLDVRLIGPSDPNDPPKWVATKKADIALTYQPQFLEQVDRGMPLIRIGTLIDKPLNCLVVLKESGIKSIKDLKGKKIGTTGSGLTGVMLNNMLKEYGIHEKDVTKINVRYNLTQALLSRRVDAVTGLMRNFEVPQLEASGHKVIAFFPEEHHMPNYSELIFISHKDKVRDARLPRFIAAVKEAIAYYDAHPRETWSDFAKTYPESDNRVNKEAWFSTIPYFAEDPSYFDQKEWMQFAQFMHEQKLIRKLQPINRYAIRLDINQALFATADYSPQDAKRS